MGPIGVQEMVVIFLVALVLFGPKKLPELGKTLAKAVTEFRRAQSDLKATFEREMQSIEKETESLKEATRQAAVDLTSYSDIDLIGGSAGSYDQRASEVTPDHPTVSASAVPGAESYAELSAPHTPNHEDGALGTTPAETTPGVEGTVPRGATGSSESVSSESMTAASTAAPDESNPLPEFVQTRAGSAVKPADAELPSIV
jgi:sec-independent protein translocase protein TatA